jgi:pimeloyl-ACP methyl ester carboxylesterase
MLSLLLALPLAAVTYQTFGRWRDARRFPPPGRLIQIGASRLHLHRTGTGSPSVVLEAGIAGTSLTWSLVQPGLAELTTVASYDRTGLGWSDSCSTPRTVHTMVQELSSMLVESGLSGPYVLVGHSFGGLLVRAYAAAYPEQVAALVLVDPVSLVSWAQNNPADLRRLSLGARLSRRGAWLARLGLVRLALAFLVAGAKRLPKLIGRAAAGPGSRVMERLAGEVRRLPPSVWPVVQAHWSNPKCFRAMAAYLECLPASARHVLPLKLNPQIPIRILSAGNATATELEERECWAKESFSGGHVRLDNCGHWIPLERPDVVIAAVQELVTDVGMRCGRAS